MSTSSNLVGNLFDASIQADADGKVTIEGDLTVEGTTTSIETVNLKVEDKLIELAHGTAGTPSGDAGIIIERGDSTNASLIWDESADTWVVSTTNATGASSGDLTLTDAALKAAAITASGVVTATGFTIGSAVITEAELEILDGATLSTTELNYVDGVTSAIQTQFTGKQPVDADLTALSSCQTGGAAALALLTATEVAILDGATLSTTELNYVDGVTGAIQTQLNTKGVTAGSASITTVGTIGTGTWQGTAVASAYLDADTAHLSGTQTFTGTKTLNSFKGTGGATVTNILDEDAMGSNSATALATQQSIKAYADTKSVLAGSSSITTVGTVAAGTWQGTAIASAYLDADTVHLTTNQTLSGEKTFTADLVVTTANHSVTVDVSEDEMILAGDTKLSFNDANGGENISADAGGTLVVNAGAILDAVAPTIDLNASTKIIVNSPIMQMFSGTTAKPLISLECTNPDALGGTFQFVKNGASVADNDVIGTVKFVSEDDGDVVHTYSTIESTIDDMTGGQESGKLKLSVASHDGGVEQGLLLSGGSVDAEVDVTIGNGAASVTTVAGLLSVTSGVALEEASSLEIIAPLLPTNDHASSGIIALMLAGGAIAAFQTVCAHTTTGEVVITDSNAIATMPVIGIAPVAISDTATGPIMLQGFIRDDTWTWTIGGIMYASETAGAMTQTAPTTSGAFVQALGVAISADVVYFNPSLTLVEVA